MPRPWDKTESASLHKLRDYIQKEAPFIGLKPYSHNLVRLTLADICRKFGVAEANRAVRDFNLVVEGFTEKPEPEASEEKSNDPTA